MADHETTRTLVKSPPELWAECSDPASLARHLDGFGDIRIIRLEPETAVAWEGERASGTVRLEPAGWGTRVTLTATERAGAATAAPPAPAEPAPAVEEPAPALENHAPAVKEAVIDADADSPASPSRRGVFERLFGLFRRGGRAEAEPAGAAAAPAEAPAAPTAAEEERGEAPQPELLVAALESLGRAHHRPYSRS